MLTHINHFKMSKIKNSIGNPDVEATTLRGTGKLDWTPRAKLNSTVKRLSSTLAVDDRGINKANKEKRICPHCMKKFTVSKNAKKLPLHYVNIRKFDGETKEWYNESQECSSKNAVTTGYNVESKYVKRITIEGETFAVGNKVMFSKINYQYPGVTKIVPTFYEGNIESIRQFPNHKYIIYLERGGNDSHTYGLPYFELKPDTLKDIIKI